MGTYCYTLRAKTVKVQMPATGTAIKVPTFEYSYKPIWSHWAEFDPKYQRMVGSKLAAAERAFEKHKDADGTVLALDGEWLVRTRRPNYLDGETPEHYHVQVLGRVSTVQIGRRTVRVFEAKDMSAA